MSTTNINITNVNGAKHINGKTADIDGNLTLETADILTAQEVIDLASIDNKVDKITGKGLSTEDYTTTEKNKLSGIAIGAEVNVQADWNQSDNTQDDFIKNKPSINGFESTSNKISSIAGEETSEIKYPNVKAIIDWFNASKIRSILGISTLSGSNTGDQDLSGYLNGSSTTANLPDSTDKRYVTDSNLLSIGRIDVTISGNPTIVGFSRSTDYGTSAVPLTNASFTDSLSGAVRGLKAKIYHNSATAPTFPVNWVKISGEYVPSTLNIIEAYYSGTSTRVEYSYINDVSLKLLKSNNLSDLVSASTARTNLGLGSLATQNGTFSDKQDTLVSATNIKTINGVSVLGSGDLTVGSTSGIWGIANSSGVYTYYATYQLARSAAVAGQTIEMFGSQTESTANHILKDGVNINYNGYTLTFTSGFGLIDNNVACEVQLLNGEIKKGVSGQYLCTILNSSTILRGNVLINSSLPGGFGLYGPATVIGLNFKGSYPLYLYSAGAKGKAYGVTINCTSGNAIAYGEVYNSIINSTSTTDPAMYQMSVINNCSGVQNGYYSVYCNGVIIQNCSFTNLTSSMLSFASQDNNFIDNCYFRIASGYLGLGNGNGKGLMSNCKVSGIYYLWTFGAQCINMDNCILITDTSYTFYALSQGKFNNCTFIVRDTTNSFQDCDTNVIKINNCNFQLANTSAYPVYFASAKNFTASNNTYNTTNFQLNGTNLQTFTADAYGNQRLN